MFGIQRGTRPTGQERSNDGTPGLDFENDAFGNDSTRPGFVALWIFARAPAGRAYRREEDHVVLPDVAWDNPAPVFRGRDRGTISIHSDSRQELERSRVGRIVKQ